jgi:hypothetical protein
MLQRQTEIAHAQRKLEEPCPFCRSLACQLWYDPAMADSITPYQVRCGACGARGPWCDCGDESAVPNWLNVVRKE